MSLRVLRESHQDQSHLSPPHGQGQHTLWYWFPLGGSLHKVCPCQVHVSEHLVPSCWRCLVVVMGRWVGLMEPLGGGALLEEVCLCEWVLGVYRPYLFSVYSL